MAISLHRATPTTLDEIVREVATWQHDEGSIQLHPGDFGWNWGLSGPAELADAVRVWDRDGEIVAVGMVDDDTGLIRMAIAPSIDHDDAFAAQLLADLSDPGRVLPGGVRVAEVRFGTALRGLLGRRGWVDDEPWTPLRRDLTAPVEDCGLRIEHLAVDHVRERILRDRIDVHRASFTKSTFTVERWRTMATGTPYRQARCLVGYDAAGDAVAATTVWSAGEGRPGLIEPLGVHQDHRGHGYGRAITRAAAAALQRMGASSATVSTPSSNVGAVATYASAGFQRLPDVTDFRRTG